MLGIENEVPKDVLNLDGNEIINVLSFNIEVGSIILAQNIETVLATLSNSAKKIQVKIF